VEVVLQQTVSVRESDGFDIPGVPLQEETIVALLHEHILAVGAAIVDVIIDTVLQ
jgi:hypothetical protein